MAHDETTPLMGPRTAAAMDQSLKHRHPKASYTAWFVVGLVFAFMVAADLQRAPWQRMVESIFCRDYFRGGSPERAYGDIPESQCKIPAIQSQVAALVGWDLLLSYLPGLFLTIPYGALCDRWGRKPVFFLSAAGILLGQLWMFLVAFLAQRQMIDLQWSLFSNALNMIGGGSPVAVTALYSMVADSTTEATRSLFFFRLTAASLGATLVAIPVASAVMQQSVWGALGASTAAFFLTLLGAWLLLPETLKFRKEAIVDAAVGVPDDTRPDEGVRDSRSVRTLSDRAEVESYFARAMRQVSQYKFVFGSPLILSLAVTFLVHSLGRVAMEFLLNLASNRYSWSFAQANFLIPISSISTLVLLVLVLPRIQILLRSRAHMSPMQTNLAIARGSVLVATLGFVGIAVAPVPAVMILSIVVFALGTGFSPAVRDVATAIAPPEAIAKMYSVFQTFDAVGGVIAGPMMSQSFIKGMGWGGLWNGLPFLLGGVLYAFVAVIIWVVRLPSEEPEAASNEEEEELIRGTPA